MELFDLTGKVAVITGSSKGIGKAIAERLAEHGAKVTISLLCKPIRTKTRSRIIRKTVLKKSLAFISSNRADHTPRSMRPTADRTSSNYRRLP